jgi:hypothetical protein
MYMPSLSYSDIRRMTPEVLHTFIETGTFMGATTSAMIPYFNKIITIELSAEIANWVRYRFSATPNVTALQGDSTDILPKICKDITEPTFFWLDGHWSGGITAQGKKDCPLIEEVDAINTYCKSRCVIAIDDVRLFGKKINEDWTDITSEKILNIVKKRIDSYNYYPSELDPKDRLIITLNAL